MEEFRSHGKHDFEWGSKTLVAKEFGINKSMVTKWLKKSAEFEATPNQRRKYAKLVTGKRQHYPEQEDMLFDAFYVRRSLLGLWVDRYWLQDEFYEILKLTKPDGWEDFRCSSGWVSNFCRRFSITKQARTNKKDVPIAVKEPWIRSFHKQVLNLQKTGIPEDPAYDATYGRFGPDRMFHADQSPCEFAMPGKYTLNFQGSPCWMWQPGTGLDKRFITIHLCIRATGEQIIKPVIIFRGQGLQLSQAEVHQLNALTNIKWYFQPKAWADGEFCRWWLQSFKEDLQLAGLGDAEVLLGLDGLAGQHNSAFYDRAVAENVVPVYTPPDCTDVVAPCDHHVFVRLKGLIKDFYHAQSEASREDWASSKDNDSLSASKRRILLAQWVSAAWKILCEGSDSEEWFKKSFTSTGFLMKLRDPSADIKIKGLEGYTVEQ